MNLMAYCIIWMSPMCACVYQKLGNFVQSCYEMPMTLVLVVISVWTLYIRNCENPFTGHAWTRWSRIMCAVAKSVNGPNTGLSCLTVCSHHMMSHHIRFTQFPWIGLQICLS